MVEMGTMATADEPFDGPALVEARVTRVTRLPSLGLVPGQELHVIPNVACRGPIELEVAWDV